MITRAIAFFATVLAALSGCSSASTHQNRLDRWYPNRDFYEGLQIEELAVQAENGPAEARIEYATRLMNGDRTTRDSETAVIILRELSEDNDPRAQYFLGAAYFQGSGVKANPKKGLELMRQSAEANYDQGQYWYGYMISRGRGVPAPNWDVAIPWFRKAARQGHPDAQFSLGEAIESCRGGLRRDFDQAAHWYRKAGGEQGHIIALYNLRRLIDLGLVEWQKGDPGEAPEEFIELREDHFQPCADPSQETLANFQK